MARAGFLGLGLLCAGPAPPALVAAAPNGTFSPLAASTLAPTPLTPAPTPDPTRGCQEGFFIDLVAGGACTPCATGQYSNVTRAPWPTSCNSCQAGRYTNVVQDRTHKHESSTSGPSYVWVHLS